MSLIRLSADNPASLLAAAVLIIVFGIIGIVTLPIQMLPDIEYPEINVNTSWRNAAPQEIEANIIEPQEDALRQVPGVVELSSNIRAGNGNVNLEFDVGTDLQRAVIDVLNALNNVEESPPDAGRTGNPGGRLGLSRRDPARASALQSGRQERRLGVSAHH